MSIVEREIQQQNEREAELMAQRQSLYHHRCPPPPHHDSRSPSTTPEGDQPPYEPTSADHLPRFSPGEASHHHPQKTTPASSSSSSTPAPPPPPPPPSSVRRISYEEAISCPSHPGESLIAREIEELKRREEELRQSRRQQDQRQPLQLRESSVDGDDDNDHGPSSSFSSAAPDLDRAARARVPSIERPSRRRTMTIQPLLDGPMEEEQAAKFLPEEGETPIEREMRRLKEKEAALRQERGLPVEDAGQEGRRAIVEVAGEGVGMGMGSFDRRNDQTMKRLASSLLMVEIEKEQQREVELRRHSQHTTTTTSSESARSSDAAKTIPSSYNRCACAMTFRSSSEFIRRIIRLMDSLVISGAIFFQIKIHY